MPEVIRSIVPVRGGAALLALAGVALLALSGPAAALTFTVNFDTSVTTNSNAANIESAFNAATGFYASTYTDPINITLNVGWGFLGSTGTPVSPGALGESSTFIDTGLTYAQVRNALIADAKSPDDAIAVSSLPAADPTGGKSELMAVAEGRAIGLSATGPGRDADVGFDSTASWAFGPNRAVPGEYDLIGVAEHEIAETMGRFADLGTFFNSLSPLDLFRYTGPGTRQLTAPASAPCGFFSIDGGTTSINSFNCDNGGDLGDWAGATVDSYNAFATLGVELPVSAGDIREMDVLGYDLPLAVATPEPGTLALLGSSLLGFAAWRRRRRQ